MTTRTITFDDEQWQVVPKQLTPEMLGAALWPACLSADYALALAAAPEPPAQQPMTDDADPDTIAALLRERDALRAENERLAKDASRYRQLIENFSHSYPMTQEEPAEHTLVFEWRQSDLSEAGWSIHDAIDAALADGETK